MFCMLVHYHPCLWSKTLSSRSRRMCGISTGLGGKPEQTSNHFNFIFQRQRIFSIFWHTERESSLENIFFNFFSTYYFIANLSSPIFTNKTCFTSSIVRTSVSNALVQMNQATSKCDTIWNKNEFILEFQNAKLKFSTIIFQMVKTY